MSGRPKYSYLTTHPFLVFRVNLRKADPEFWMLLGEARSKCEHIARVPLRGDTAKELSRMYVAKGVMATTAIEGNTLSEEQVRKRLAGDLKLPPSQEYLGREVDNMKAAYNHLVEDLADGVCERLSPELLSQLNATILDGLDLEPGVVAGELRTHSVSVGNYVGPPAEECPYLLKRLCDWLYGQEFDGPPDRRVEYAVLKGILAHLYLAWIHPFGDGNGRLARLAEFQLLVSGGVPVPAAHVLTSHYNKTRTEYYRQLSLSSRPELEGNVLPFLHYALRGLVDSLRQQLEVVHQQQVNLAWNDYLDQWFRHHRYQSPTAHRRRLLVLHLTRAGGWVSKQEILNLAPELAMLYASKTPKTLTRDLNEMDAAGLIESDENGYRARIEHIYSFLPPAG
jgi:Fic family protein